MSIRFLTSFFLSALAAVFAATWSEANVGLPSAVVGVHALTVDPVSPSTIYAHTSSGIFKSTDGAAARVNVFETLHAGV